MQNGGPCTQCRVDLQGRRSVGIDWKCALSLSHVPDSSNLLDTMIEGYSLRVVKNIRSRVGEARREYSSRLSCICVAGTSAIYNYSLSKILEKYPGVDAVVENHKRRM